MSIGIEIVVPESPGQALTSVQLLELISHSCIQNGPHAEPTVFGLEETTLT